MKKRICQFGDRRLMRDRRGAVLSEALVAAAILLAGIGILAKSQYNLRRLGSDTSHFQLATDELSNQLDRLTRLPKDQLPDSLSNLKVSEEVAERLPGCRINGNLIEDSLGPRIQLNIDWTRVGTGKPVELVGWLKPDVEADDTDAKPAKAEPSPSDSTPTEIDSSADPTSADPTLSDSGAKP